MMNGPDYVCYSPWIDTGVLTAETAFTQTEGWSQTQAVWVE